MLNAKCLTIFGTNRCRLVVVKKTSHKTRRFLEVLIILFPKIRFSQFYKSDLFSERIWPSGRSLPSVLPPCGILRISGSDGEASVLLLDQVLPVAVLDAHPGRFAQLEEESLGKLGVARDSTVGHLPVFSILPLQVDLTILGSLHLYGGIGSLIALQPARAGCLVADEALLALQHQDWPVDQVEVVLAALIDSVNVGKEMSRLLCPDKLPIVGLEGDGPVLQPVEVKQGCVGSPSLSCLQAPSSLQAEVFILHGPDCPLGCLWIKLQLESFVVADLLLVRRHINPLLDRHKSLVAHCLEACLGKGVFQ